ncbi:MAG: hypothetical protein GEU73_13755 [Chloroflexi bacterium]|nr:hypothetical protein [Chloroflexota bacterium]
MSRMLRMLAATWLLVTVVLVAPPSVALAHERRDVGQYTFVVGWLVEPAFTGEKNGISLRITDRDTGQPVEGLEDMVSAEVVFGGQRRNVDLRAVFRDPGHYTADLVPTRDGDYRFQFIGTVGGSEVNETFDSADGGFHGVELIDAIQFPVAAAANAPAQAASQTADQRVAAAEQAVAANQTLAIVGIAVGVLGVLLGGLALVARGRRERAAEQGGAPRIAEEPRG